MKSKTGLLIGLILLLFGGIIIYYYQISPQNKEDVLGAEYENILEPGSEDEVLNPTEIYVPLEIYDKAPNYKISDFFPNIINGQNILNLYPEKGDHLIYPFGSDLYLDPEDENYPNIETDYHYQAFYLTYDPENLKDELPVNIHVMKIKEGVTNQEVLDTMDYIYDYPNDIFGNFNMEGENAYIWGAYMPEVYARGAPLDYSYKHTSYRMYLPKDRIMIELGTAYKNYKEEGHDVLKEYLEYLVNAQERENVDESLVLTDTQKFNTYEDYEDQFISRLKKINENE